MKFKRMVSFILSALLVLVLPSCSATDETTHTPLPPSATPDEITSLKADTLTDLTCLYSTSSDSCYTADSIWIDDSKEDYLAYERALLDRFETLTEVLNVRLEPLPIEDGLDSFWTHARLFLDSQDSTIDIIVRPQSFLMPDEMERYFVKRNTLLTDSGSVILGDVTGADPYSVLGDFSLTAKSEPIALYLNESLLPKESSLLEGLPTLIKTGSFTFSEFLKIAKLPLSEGISPLVTEKNTLEAYLTLAFSAKTPNDDTVKNAISLLEAQKLVHYHDDPETAFLENRALFIFAPIGSLGIGRPLRAVWNTTVALPLPKENPAASYNTCYSERLDLYSISNYSDHPVLAAAALAYLDHAADDALSEAFYHDLYACRCPCIRSEIWKETVKVYENDTLFRLYALDKGEKG